MRGKTGQFFILATLLILILVTSLSIGMNKVTSRVSQNDFYVLTNQFDQELSKVIDYQTVHGASTGNLSSFINVSADYLNYVQPETGFVVYYLEGSNITMENHLKLGNSCMKVLSTDYCASTGLKNTTPLGGDTEIDLTVVDLSLVYNISKGSKSYIVFMRTIDNEVYINVKE